MQRGGTPHVSNAVKSTPAFLKENEGISYLEEELLVGGPPLPSRLAKPGPVRAPSPPSTKGRGTRLDAMTFRKRL